MSYLPTVRPSPTGGTLDDILTPGTKWALGLIVVVGASRLVGLDPFRPIWRQKKRSRR